MNTYITLTLTTFLLTGCNSSVTYDVGRSIARDVSFAVAERAYELATTNNTNKFSKVDSSLKLQVCNSNGVYTYESGKTCSEKKGRREASTVVECIYGDGGKELTDIDICLGAGFGKVVTAHSPDYEQRVLNDSRQRQLSLRHYSLMKSR